VRGADVEKLFGHDVLREFGGIAFPAQVRQVKLPQTGRHDLGDGLGSRDVGNMAVTAEDALFERPRTARTILQHLYVVVGFEDEDVRVADAFKNQFCDVAKVGGEADIARGGVENEANRVLGVVRQRKSFDAHLANFKTRASFEQPPVNLGFESVLGFQRQIGLFAPFFLEGPDGAVLRATVAKDGNVELVRQPEQPGNMVGMFVRQENGGEIFRGPADAGKALADLPGGKPGIHEDARFAGFQIGAIAGGTAAENGESYGHRIKLVAVWRTGKFI